MSIVLARSKEGVTAYAVPGGTIVWQRVDPCRALKTSSEKAILVGQDSINVFTVPSFTAIASQIIGEWSDISISPCMNYAALTHKGALKVVNIGSGKTIFTDTLGSGSGAAVLAPKWLLSEGNQTVRFARIGKGEIIICTIHCDSDLIERHSLPIPDGQPASIFSFDSVLFAFIRTKQQPNQLLLIKEDGKVAKSFPMTRADRIDIVANTGNNKFLVTAHADVDSSGKSYYGESFLMIIDSATLALQRTSISGPFHDVAWMDSDRFIALHGFMPASCTVISASTGNVVHTVSPDADGKKVIGSKNTIRCDPNSGLTALAGFGNLPGSVEIWRIDPKSSSCAKVGAFSAPGTISMDWLLHDSHQPALICATTHPRLRVDNQWRLFSWTGAQLAETVEYKELYSVSVVSQGVSVGKLVDEAALKIAARLNVSAKKAEPYRPPSLRAASPATTTTTTAATSTKTKEEKVLKRLQERLDQITELKARRAKGESLEANQVDKIEREPEVRKELEALMKIMQKRRLHLQEWQGKTLLANHNINVQRFKVVSDVKDLTSDINWPTVVVKAQCEAGGRGKGRFINSEYRGVEVLQNCPNHQIIKQTVLGMLNQKLVTAQTGPEGILVDKVMVVEGRRELGPERYLAIILDRHRKQPMVMVSNQGGMAVEECGDLVQLCTLDEIGKISGVLGIPLDAAQKLIMQLHDLLVQNDAIMVEINPLCIMPGEEPLAVDAKITIDDNALFRHVRKYSTNTDTDTDQQHNYVKLDGNGHTRTVGCMVNGAGLAMATMDMLGDRACNFLDVGGTATSASIKSAFSTVLSDQRVKTIFVNVFGGIVRCDVIAEGIKEALADPMIGGVVEERLEKIVVRLAGTNAEIGLRALEGVPKVIPCADLQSAASMALETDKLMEECI